MGTVDRPIPDRQKTAFTVGIIHVVQFRTLFQRPATRQRRHILCTERGLLFCRTQSKREILLSALVIIPIFQILVVQVIVAQHVRLHMSSGIMPVRSPYRKSLLFYLRQIAQNIIRTFVFSCQIRIQLHPVYSGQCHHRQFVVRRQTGLYLKLPVDIVRKERQTYHFKK